MLATLLRGPNFTLAVTSCFRSVALHIVALAIATTSSRSAARTAEPQQWRVRAALEAVALIRLLDITPQALRWHPKHALRWLPSVLEHSQAIVLRRQKCITRSYEIRALPLSKTVLTSKLQTAALHSMSTSSHSNLSRLEACCCAAAHSARILLQPS